MATIGKSEKKAPKSGVQLRRVVCGWIVARFVECAEVGEVTGERGDWVECCVGRTGRLVAARSFVGRLVGRSVGWLRLAAVGRAWLRGGGGQVVDGRAGGCVLAARAGRQVVHRVGKDSEVVGAAVVVLVVVMATAAAVEVAAVDARCKQSGSAGDEEGRDGVDAWRAGRRRCGCAGFTA